MRWSWRVGHIAGIGIYVHATFVLLLCWIGLVQYHESGTLLAAAPWLAFLLADFGIVVLHEPGHALA